jgi:hypothetical protein
MDLRPPEQAMRLARMGAAFPTRLSFMRSLVRRMTDQNWRFEKILFDVDEQGFGTSILAVHTPDRTYSILVFTHDLPPEMRTDRVIAEAWDATFNLIDGIPDEGDIARLSQNTPKQEGGRFSQKELVLARANKSVRLFGHMVDRLANGQQPDMDQVAPVGYLMRTTAVYGNGKFGIADRGLIADRPEAMGSFQIEMLAVYMFRWFTLELVQHIARQRGGDQAVDLDPGIARFLGIGNATGLGMAPFLVNHPRLVDRWVTARETALARVRGVPAASTGTAAGFCELLDRLAVHVSEWRVEDEIQSARIEVLEQDIVVLQQQSAVMLSGNTDPWDALYRYAEAHCSIEGQELLISLMLEVHPDEVDALADGLFAPEHQGFDAAMTCGELQARIHAGYQWTLDLSYGEKSESARFWYYSEDKLEPRFGSRFEEDGAEREMPLAIARDVAALSGVLTSQSADRSLGAFVRDHPDFLRTVRRIQLNVDHPYSEIRDNLIAESVRPIDILRFKLAFFGACRFDPKSDLWTRISMYMGAPLPHELAMRGHESWSFPIAPQAVA